MLLELLLKKEKQRLGYKTHLYGQCREDGQPKNNLTHDVERMTSNFVLPSQHSKHLFILDQSVNSVQDLYITYLLERRETL